MAVKKKSTKYDAITPSRVFLKIILIVWVMEGLIMIVLNLLPKLPEPIEALVDATSLSVLILIPIWFWIIRPIKDFASEDLFYLDSLEKAIDSAAIVAISDPKGEIKHVNEAYCLASGYEENELIGQNHRILKSNYHQGVFYENLWSTIKSGKVWKGEIKNKRKDGEYYWVDSTIIPVSDVKGNLWRFISINFDITKIKLAESVLLEAKNMAEAATKTKAEFLANMSHEIRTPLNGVLGMGILLADEKLSEDGWRHLHIMQQSGDALLGIINNILDFSKIEADKLKIENVSFDLRSIIEDVVFPLRLQAKSKSIEINIDIEKNIPANIVADVTRLRQILMNLIGNAIKFTERGEINIFAELIQAASAKSYIKIEIRDTGIGISKEVLDLLFLPFSQVDASTSRRFGGTGLGLAICKGICQAMGGKIEVESEEGVGSAFTFTFAVTLKEIKEQTLDLNKTHIPYNTDLGKLKPLRILVADDNLTNQILAKKFLEKLGYEKIKIVSNGQEVLQEIRKNIFDVILLDGHMPGLDGYETIKAIHHEIGIENSPWVIGVSASATNEDKEKCLQCGMNDFLAKPYKISDLVLVLERVPLAVFNSLIKS